MQIQQLTDYILAKVNENGYQAYIWHKNNDGHSAYIRFKNERMGSIRISDHKGVEKYKYKYNVRIDIKHSFKEVDKGIWREYFTINDIGELLVALQKRKEISSTWEGEPKFKYGIPKHKRN